MIAWLSVQPLLLLPSDLMGTGNSLSFLVLSTFFFFLLGLCMTSAQFRFVKEIFPSFTQWQLSPTPNHYFCHYFIYLIEDVFIVISLLLCQLECRFLTSRDRGCLVSFHVSAHRTVPGAYQAVDSHGMNRQWSL